MTCCTSTAERSSKVQVQQMQLRGQKDGLVCSDYLKYQRNGRIRKGCVYLKHTRRCDMSLQALRNLKIHVEGWAKTHFLIKF